MTSKYYSRTDANLNLTFFFEDFIDLFADLFRNQKKYGSKIKLLESGDEKTILDCLENLFNKNKILVQVPGTEKTSIKITANFSILKGCILVFNLNFPTIDIIPTQIITQSKSGKEIIHKKSLLTINQEYKDLVLAVSTCVIHSIMKVIPTVNNIYFSGYVTKMNELRGFEYQACLLSTIIDVATYDELIIENITSENILKNFPLRFIYDKNFEIKEITPFVCGKILEKEFIDLDSIDPKDFERLITALLERFGFRAITTQFSRDGGIDVIANNEDPIVGGKVVVQCKRHKNIISVSDVRDLYGVVTHERANKGVFITTSDYSTDCLNFAEGKPIELVNRTKLLMLLKKYGFKIKK